MLSWNMVPKATLLKSIKKGRGLTLSTPTNFKCTAFQVAVYGNKINEPKMKTTESNFDVNQNQNYFNLSSQISLIKQDENWEKSGRSSRTLAKVGALRLVLNTMKAGTEIKTHHASGPISVHCIEGKLKFNTEEGSVVLKQGELLTLEELVKHSVEAVEETTFLLTVALQSVK